MLADSRQTFGVPHVMNIVLTLSMFVLLIVSLMMTVIILMQKPSANAGMGAALGGGAAESVFGGETANVLLKYTVRISVAFFVVSFLLYVGYLWHHRSAPVAGNSALPNIPGATAPANATTAPANATAAPASSAPAAGSGFNVTTTKPAASAPAPAAASATPAASSPAAASTK